MNVPWRLNMLCDRNMAGFWNMPDTQGSEYAWVCSCITLECLNMPEAKPKITLQAK